MEVIYTQHVTCDKCGLSTDNDEETLIYDIGNQVILCEDCLNTMLEEEFTKFISKFDCLTEKHAEKLWDMFESFVKEDADECETEYICA